MKTVVIFKKSRQANPVIVIADLLASWTPDSTEAKMIGEKAARSLQEVTHLTEYQDDKANRILTAMAFLSAFAGAVFAVFLQQFPIGSADRFRIAGQPGRARFITVLFGVFGGYVLLLVSGAALVVWALRPRFNVPKGWKGSPGSRPKSYLFFEKIIEAGPEQWAKAFTNRGAADLELDYTRNSILESYLIAEKIGNKLRILQPGVLLLSLSVPLLAVWSMLTVWALFNFPAPPTSLEKPTIEIGIKQLPPHQGPVPMPPKPDVKGQIKDGK